MDAAKPQALRDTVDALRDQIEDLRSELEDVEEQLDDAADAAAHGAPDERRALAEWNAWARQEAS